MADTIDRRTALGLAAAALIPPLVAAGAAQAQAAAPGRLTPGQPPMSAMIPNTQYFEIDSAVAGARYAVWVTTPALYDRDPNARFPVIYTPDGNAAVGSIGSDVSVLSAYDPINPLKPFVLVCVGYTGADVDRSLAVRARDLLPPHEALQEGTDEGVRATAKIGLLDPAGAELYIHNLHNPAGDKFLSFLQDELHPLIAQQFRVERETAGLFGYSYGGLFATYVALTRSPLFHKIGAGSPGILAHKSIIFEMYADEAKAGADHTGRLLHMTINERELTLNTPYLIQVGAGASEFMELAGTRPLKGLKFTSRIVEFESHISGYTPSWYSFLRTGYSA